MVPSSATTPADDTVAGRKFIAGDLRKTRERGYSINNGEMGPSERYIGAPVRNPSGRIIAGLSLSSTARRLTD